MPFCPKCKTEYRDGFTICSDCKVELVAKLSDIKTVEKTYEETFEEKDITEYANEDDFGSKVDTEIETNREAVIEATPEDIKTINEFIEVSAKTNAKEYVSDTTKAKELLSTGIFLIIMGIVFSTFLTLYMLKLTPFSFRGGFSYVIVSILICFFLSFIYFGISSLIKYNGMRKTLDQGKDKRNEFEKWFSENISKEVIDKGLPLTDNEEQNFFYRNEKIKFFVFKSFPDLDQKYVETYIDSVYEDIF